MSKSVWRKAADGLKATQLGELGVVAKVKSVTRIGDGSLCVVLNGGSRRSVIAVWFGSWLDFADWPKKLARVLELLPKPEQWYYVGRVGQVFSFGSFSLIIKVSRLVQLEKGGLSVEVDATWGALRFECFADFLAWPEKLSALVLWLGEPVGNES